MNTKRLVLDTSNLPESDNVGAYLRSSDGTLITHTTVGAKEALDVYVSGMAGQYEEDSAHTDADIGSFILAVRNDADTSLAGSDGDYAPLQVDENGRLKVVADIEVANGFEKIEDDAHSSGDVGAYMLSVREDTLASSTSASGDYQSIKTDALGRLWMNDASQVGAYSAISVTNTATDLVATDLANRKKISIQNQGSRSIFVGMNASVTAANGTEISPGGSAEFAWGPGINVHAITASGTADVRILEF